MGWIVFYDKYGKPEELLGDIDPKLDYEGITTKGRKLNKKDQSREAYNQTQGRS